MKILGTILAGGGSRRFGADKSAALLDGRSLLECVIARARPQVAALSISAGPEFRAFGDISVIGDKVPGAGPLAGVMGVLRWAEQREFDAVATFPCDSPFFPADLVKMLGGALGADTDCAMASTRGTTHFAFALWRTACVQRVEKAFEGGLRSLHGVNSALRVAIAKLPPGEGPGGDAFFNINTQGNLTTAEAWLHERKA